MGEGQKVLDEVGHRSREEGASQAVVST